MVEPGWPQIIWHMRFACWIPKARIRTRACTHTQKNLLLFYSKNCYANAPQHSKYVVLVKMCVCVCVCVGWGGGGGKELFIMWPYKDILCFDVAQNVAHRRSHTEGRTVRNQILISSVYIIIQLLRS